MSVSSVICWWCKKVIMFNGRKPSEPYTCKLTTRNTKQPVYPYKEGKKRDHAPMCSKCEQEKKNAKK